MNENEEGRQSSELREQQEQYLQGGIAISFIIGDI
jgi:hypothetical protein